MEGPIYQQSFPFRPIPVYGQRIQTGVTRFPPSDEASFSAKIHEDSLALTKHLNLISQMHHLRSLGDYRLGQFGPTGNINSNQVLHSVDRLAVKSLGACVDNGHTHAISEQHANAKSKELTDLSTPKSQTESISALRHSPKKPDDNDRSFIDRMTVPVIVSCANPFTSQYGYGRKVFPCPQCRYTTDRRNNLKRHMLTMHQTCSKTLECCGIVFATKASLREHSMIFHYHGYTCFYCGRRFCRKALLKRHLSVHNGQKDFVCPVCDYATSHKSNLERHRKVHCRPEDRKPEDEDCGTENFMQKTMTWRVDGHDADDNVRECSGISDDEDEEINVDSD